MTDRDCSRTITTISDYTTVSPLTMSPMSMEAGRWSYAKVADPVRTFRRVIAHVWSGSLDRYSIRVCGICGMIRLVSLSRYQQQQGLQDRATKQAKACYSESLQPCESGGVESTFPSSLVPTARRRLVGNPWHGHGVRHAGCVCGQKSPRRPELGWLACMLGDAQQAFCKRARGQTVFGAGGAGMRERRSPFALHMAPGAQLQGCCSAQTLLFRLLRR